MSETINLAYNQLVKDIIKELSVSENYLLMGLVQQRLDAIEMAEAYADEYNENQLNILENQSPEC